MNYEMKQLSAAQNKIKESLLNRNYHPILAHLLALRNYRKQERLDHYSLLKDMGKAVDYMFDAILQNKKIGIISDYDVDGATSCAIMYRGLTMMGANVHFTVPNRFKHGYGLQVPIIKEMLEREPDTQVIITVDNGISSFDGVDFANQQHIDVIVTDHHLDGDSKPNAYAIINPNQKGCDFPSKALAGCGVAFYFIKALFDKFASIQDFSTFSLPEQEKIQFAAQAKIIETVDYLTIGTIADVVPLDSNNQMILNMGLKRMRSGLMNVGVKALLTALSIKPEKLTSSHIAFGIAPVLNAAGRLYDMRKSVDLFLETNFDKALHEAQSLVAINEERKRIEKEMTKIAFTQMDSKYPFCMVVSHKKFHEGIIGIVASRLKEEFYLPCIVFAPVESESDNERAVLKGSGRSIPELHLRDAIDWVDKKYPDCVIKFGGHSMAAGLSIYADKLEQFRSGLNEYCKEIFKGIVPSHKIQVDMEIDLSSLTNQDVQTINQQAWGQNFPEPLFYGRFEILEQTILKNAHLKLKLLQQDTGVVIDGLYFFHAHLFISNHIEATFKLNLNEFNGRQTMQIFIDNADILNELSR